MTSTVPDISPGTSTSEFKAVVLAIVLAVAHAALAWINPNGTLTDTERTWLTAGSGVAVTFLVGLYSTHRTGLKAQVARAQALANEIGVDPAEIANALAASVSHQATPAAAPPAPPAPYTMPGVYVTPLPLAYPANTYSSPMTSAAGTSGVTFTQIPPADPPAAAPAPTPPAGPDPAPTPAAVAPPGPPT